MDTTQKLQLQSLISRYSSATPRYTSYPTAVEFKDEFGVSDWKRALSEEPFRESPQTALYVHIPFCRTLCFFCACSKEITKNKGVIAPYFSALEREVSEYKCFASSMLIEQLHLGGGSPNFLGPEALRMLDQLLRDVFQNFSPNADISAELDPRATTREQVATLRELGFNRLSFGVQDFNPAVQRIINRAQSFESTKFLTEVARDEGFSSIAFDLIYGLPGQTLSRWAETLEKVIQLLPDRIALYGYAHVKWKTAAQQSFDRKASLPTPYERMELFLRALEMLQSAGYRHIGLDHFALSHDDLSCAASDGRLNRNFMGYSTHSGKRVIGLGASAVSSLRSAFAQNYHSVRSYQEATQAHGFATFRGMRCGEEDYLRADIIQKIMCHGGVQIEEIERKHRISFWDKFFTETEVLRSFESDGLVEVLPKQVLVTERGRLFQRNIASVFDTYLAQHQRAGHPVFSQSI